MNIKAYIKTRSAQKEESRSKWKNYLVICECEIIHPKPTQTWDITSLTAGTHYLLIVNDIYMGREDITWDAYGYHMLQGTVAVFDTLEELVYAFNHSDISGHEPIADRQDYYFIYTAYNPWGSHTWDTTRDYYCTKDYTVQTPSYYTYSANPLSSMRPAL